MAEGNVVCFPAVVFKQQQQDSEDNQKTFTVLPIRVNFHQLLRMSSAPSVVPQVQNGDILSAVIALYDVCLPDVGPEDLYSTVHSSTASTIVLVRQHQDVLDEYRQRAQFPIRTDATTLQVYKEPGEETQGRFSQVFSDAECSTDDEDESEEDSNRQDWEKFNDELNQFILKATQRRSQRLQVSQEEEIPPAAVGVESLIVAAATYEMKRLKTREKVLQLALLSTRKKYRGCGVGRYLLELLKDQSISGSYDALLVHADSEAVQFFSHCGFTNDILLNSKFRELEDDWTNTTMMSYLPPFSTEAESQNPGLTLSLVEMELEMELWREKSLAAYQEQAALMNRLVHEVNLLRTQLVSQKELVDSLSRELDREREHRHTIESCFLEYRLKTTRQFLEMTSLNSDSDEKCQSDHPDYPGVCSSMEEEFEDMKTVTEPRDCSVPF
nr:PREDICTED: uncharacterized protein LOC107080011 isoform X1 [Lepisosteus oculatus]XP_015223711.1 PREDICTED: uncharacterized protein LOC107080011 isoform X1 [Lepisosteus oculatus]